MYIHILYKFCLYTGIRQLISWMLKTGSLHELLQGFQKKTFIYMSKPYYQAAPLPETKKFEW